MKKIKLSVELVPKTCWGGNARSTIKPSEWNKIRKLSYKDAGYKCEICRTKEPLECHEIWSYDDETHIQKLDGLISLCKLCHLTKHIGRANAMGKQAGVFEQLQVVNKWTHKQVVEHVAESFEIYKERSKHEWKLDLSLLTQEPYNLKINAEADRKFKKKTYRKRRRKKK